ncbi:MAG: Na/Pi cotransporter family protein [Planctomycetota bacterium]|jgi:phosphate:Na+ symporter
MVKEMIFGLVGGLGLFLFGMRLMSDGLKKVAGQKVRKLLSALTKHRTIAVLVGAATTCLIQSSSATTVMTVGFVNAGLMSLRQALCVVLGANVGTTFTAWLVSSLAVFKITTYSLPAIGIGFLMQMVGKTHRIRNIGNILLGFGILFTGIDFMKKGFSPLQDSQQVQQVLIYLGQNPILAVMAGAAITMLLQSSSATIAMVQILALNGAFGHDWAMALRVAIPFILGDNIGTTITAEIAAIRTTVAARRTARGHTLFNVIGVLYMLPLVWVGLFGKMVEWITPFKLSQGTIMVHIAVAHSTFNVFNTLVFLPLIRQLGAIATRTVRDKAGDEIAEPVVLEEHLLDTPVIAIDQARRGILRMAKTAKQAVNQAIEGLEQNDEKKLEQTRETEEAVDNFQFEITSYLAERKRTKCLIIFRRLWKRMILRQPNQRWSTRRT